MVPRIFDIEKVLDRSDSTSSTSSDTLFDYEQNVVGMRRRESNGSIDSLDSASSNASSSVNSSQRKPTTVEPATSAAYIRSRFLNRLGITPSPPLPLSTSPSAKRNLGRSRTEESLREALKADYGLPDSAIPAASTASLMCPSSYTSIRSAQRSNNGFMRNNNTIKTGVSFETSVTVHPIPSRNAYSNRIKAQLWTPAVELQGNAARNCLEFAAEGWDWRRVADDEDMIVYQGERIHPVHFMHEVQQNTSSSMNNQFVTVFSAQQQQNEKLQS